MVISHLNIIAEDILAYINSVRARTTRDGSLQDTGFDFLIVGSFNTVLNFGLVYLHESAGNTTFVSWRISYPSGSSMSSFSHNPLILQDYSIDISGTVLADLPCFVHASSTYRNAVLRSSIPHDYALFSNDRFLPRMTQTAADEIYQTSSLRELGFDGVVDIFALNIHGDTNLPEAATIFHDFGPPQLGGSVVNNTYVRRGAKIKKMRWGRY